MTESEWKETKREFTVAENGELVPSKVTQELTSKVEEPKSKWEPKDILDVVFRTLTLFAIGVPIMLFYWQRQEEINKQRQLFQLDVYTSTSVQLHIISSEDVSKEEFNSAKKRLLYELYPKIQLLNNPQILKLMDTCREEILVREFSNSLMNRIDSIEGTILKLLQNNTKGFSEYSKKVTELYEDYLFGHAVNTPNLVHSTLNTPNLSHTNNQLRFYMRKYDSLRNIIRNIYTKDLTLDSSQFKPETRENIYNFCAGFHDKWFYLQYYNRDYNKYYANRITTIANSLDSLIRVSSEYLSHHEK